VLSGTPIGELSHLKSYRVERGALIYIYILYICVCVCVCVCVDQQSGQWLIRDNDNCRLRTGVRLKATDAGNLLKPLKVALRTRDKVAQTQDELLS
jgi:hypothetical protein